MSFLDCQGVPAFLFLTARVSLHFFFRLPGHPCISFLDCQGVPAFLLDCQGVPTFLFSTACPSSSYSSIQPFFIKLEIISLQSLCIIILLLVIPSCLILCKFLGQIINNLSYILSIKFFCSLLLVGCWTKGFSTCHLRKNLAMARFT